MVIEDGNKRRFLIAFHKVMGKQQKNALYIQLEMARYLRMSNILRLSPITCLTSLARLLHSCCLAFKCSSILLTQTSLSCFQFCKRITNI